MTNSNAPEQLRPGLLATFGPGLAMAAAGVGAGDVTMASLGGATFGLALLWVPLVAAFVKFVLNEGLARWQLATGQTLLEGWARRLGPAVSIGFLIYLVLWTIPVLSALASTSGVAMDLLCPLAPWHPALAGPLFTGGPDRADIGWSILLVLACTLLIAWGKYAWFERAMALLTVVMFGVVVLAAGLLFPRNQPAVSWEMGSWWPDGSSPLIISIMGGTGSTVGVLAYSYWMRERGREGATWLVVTRWDLALCYLLSGLFGMGIMSLAGGVSHEAIADILHLPAGQAGQPPKLPDVFRLVSHRLEQELPPGIGPPMAFAFRLALAATVISSLLGMLQSIPYLYGDLLHMLTSKTSKDAQATRTGSLWYVRFLILLALVPWPLVLFKTPNFILMLYALWGALFIPFLAGTLVMMNNRADWVGSLRNRVSTNIVLVAALFVFGWALVSGAWTWISTGVPPLSSG